MTIEREDDDPIEPLCATVQEWVDTIYTTTYIRRAAGSGQVRWCAQWWQHAEAIVRLSALWRTWEAARANTEDPAAMANWLVHYLDTINPVLLSAEGPFGNCTPDKHEDQKGMPTQPAPPGWWS